MFWCVWFQSSLCMDGSSARGVAWQKVEEREGTAMVDEYTLGIEEEYQG